MSLSTKKSNAWSAPVRPSERYIVCKPANTRSTGSSAIGITIAVRARRSSSGGASSSDRGDAKPVAPGEQDHEPGERRPEADRDPAEQSSEKDHDAAFEKRPALVGQNLEHEAAGNDGRDQHQQQQKRAPAKRDPHPAQAKPHRAHGARDTTAVVGRRRATALCPFGRDQPSAETPPLNPVRLHRSSGERRHRRRSDALAEQASQTPVEKASLVEGLPPPDDLVAKGPEGLRVGVAIGGPLRSGDRFFHGAQCERLVARRAQAESREVRTPPIVRPFPILQERRQADLDPLWGRRLLICGLGVDHCGALIGVPHGCSVYDQVSVNVSSPFCRNARSSIGLLSFGRIWNPSRQPPVAVFFTTC